MILASDVTVAYGVKKCLVNVFLLFFLDYSNVWEILTTVFITIVSSEKV